MFGDVVNSFAWSFYLADFLNLSTGLTPAYNFDEKTITLIMLGVHENFYCSVKNILK